jgi:NTP pyrophosphatase (non-canonical NTP hydrolase)
MITSEDIDRFSSPSGLGMDQYQDQARRYAIYKKEYRVVYPTLGLAEEVGEVSGKISKWLRDGNIDKDEVAKELGDVLWFAAMLAEDLGYPLSDIAQMNLGKLENRKKRGKLRGSGDNR